MQQWEGQRENRLKPGREKSKAALSAGSSQTWSRRGKCWLAGDRIAPENADKRADPLQSLAFLSMDLHWFPSSSAPENSFIYPAGKFDFNTSRRHTIENPSVPHTPDRNSVSICAALLCRKTPTQTASLLTNRQILNASFGGRSVELWVTWLPSRLVS